MLHDFAHDVRFALRAMRKSMLLTATIVLCLGFSIGATSTVFAWMETLILQPTPGVDDLPRLVSLKTTTVDGDRGFSYPTYTEIRDAEIRAGAKTFQGLVTFDIRRINLQTDAAAEARFAEPLWAVLTSANYFDVLGVRPILGRGFLPGEGAVARGAPVVVISYALWQRRFGGDPGAIGRRVWIKDQAMSIVGVAPKGFYGTISHLGLDLWMPVTMQPEIGGSPHLLDERGIRWLTVFGRLAPGATLESARASVQATGARLAASFAADRDVTLTARPLDVGPVDRLAPLFAVMLGINGLVLLIACSNVANLLLQRGAAREHEMAVRLALGARPARVVRQLMTESLILAIGGVIVGAGMLAWARNAIAALTPASPLPIVVDTPIDGRVLLVLGSIGVSTVFLFGLAPALRSARVAVRASLSGGGVRGGSRSGGRLRGVLISAQFALSLAVLVSAGLFLRRLDELQHVDRGFRDPQEVVLTTIDFEMARLDDAKQANSRVLVERMVERLSALPGVRAVAGASFVPLGLLGYGAMKMEIDGYVPKPGESMSFLVNRVTAGYFDLMGIPIKRGRAIDPSDRRGTLTAVVVNEAFARRFWGTADPVGRILRIYGDTDLTVVGVAGDGKYEFLAPLDAPSPPFVYLSFAQWGHYEVVLHVRAAGDPLALVPSIQRAVAAVDGRLSAMSPVTLEDYSAVPYLPVRLATLVLSVLGAAALALATVGLYAVTAYAVTQQRREIGIRMALGATPVRIASHFLAHAARYVGTGALAGATLAGAMAYGLATKLPGSLPRAATDRVWPFALAVVTLGTVAALSALIPASRAARVNPTAALRDE
jgi:predicted permease